MMQDDPTIEYLRSLQALREMRKARDAKRAQEQKPSLQQVAAQAAGHSLPGLPEVVQRGVGGFIGNLPQAVGNAGLTLAQGAANLAGMLQLVPRASTELGDKIGALRERVNASRPQSRSTAETVGGVASDVFAQGLPFVASGGSSTPVTASALLTATQAAAGRDASTVGSLADLTGSETLGRVANNPGGRIASDVALDLAFAGMGNVARRASQVPPMQGPRANPASPPSMTPPTITPLATGSQVRAATIPPPSGPELTPPRTEKMPRSRQKQKAMMQSIDRTARLLERRARSNRALPMENTDATDRLTAAAAKAPRQGRVALEAANTLTGMGIGAAAGATQGETAQERVANAGLGALAGAGVGYLGNRALSMALDNIPVPDRAAMPALSNRAGKLGWNSGDMNPRLLGQHSLHKARLLQLLEHDEGIPAPSIAVMAEDAIMPGGSVSTFGNTKVYFKPHVFDPKSNPDVFLGDSYTPRAPTEDNLADRAFDQSGKYPNPEEITWTPRSAIQYMLEKHPGDWRGRELFGHAAYDSGDWKDILSHTGVESPHGINSIVRPYAKSIEHLRSALAESQYRIGNARHLRDISDNATKIEGARARAWGNAREALLDRMVGLGLLDNKSEDAYAGRLGKAAARVEEWRQRQGDGTWRWQNLTEQQQDNVLSEYSQGTRNPHHFSVAEHPNLRAAVGNLFDETANVTAMSPGLYAEAKPKRLVGWDEVAGVSFPGTYTGPDDFPKHAAVDRELMSGLRSRDIPFRIEGVPSKYRGESNYVIRTGVTEGVPERRARMVLSRRNQFLNELAVQGRNPWGFADPQLLATFAGGAGGALIGGTQGETPEDQQVNAMLGAMIGAGVGAGGARALRGRGGKPKANVPTYKPPMSRNASAYEKAVGEGLGTPKTSEPVMNPSLRGLGPDRVASGEEAILKANSAYRTGIPDEVVLDFAKKVDTDNLVWANVRKMDSAELMATGRRIEELRGELDRLLDEYGRATPEQASTLSVQIDEVGKKLLRYDVVFNGAASEQGRGLRILSRIAASRGTLESAVAAARKALGVEQLSDELMGKLRNVLTDKNLPTARAREVAMASIIRDAMKQPWWQVVLGTRRMGMLTAPATWMVNMTGNVGEAANKNFVVTPTAALLDKLYSAATGAKRTITTAGRAGGFARGAASGAREGKAMFGRIGHGGPSMSADRGLESLRSNDLDYVRDLGLQNKGAVAVAKGAQHIHDFVYTMMDAVDRPFYEAALDASYGERAHLKAMNAGAEPGTATYNDAVRFYLEKDAAGTYVNMDKADALGAEWDALDDTFKTRSPLADAVRGLKNPVLRGVAEWAVPFIKTPTNLVRKAFESMPVVGFAVNEAHLYNMKKSFAQVGISPEDIAREVRRARTMNVAKMTTTGAGLIVAGYALTMSGQLTGDYVAPMARDDADAEEANRRKLSGQPPLSIRLGNRAHSLSAFGQFAPLLALGHAFAIEAQQEHASNTSLLANSAGRGMLAGGRTVMEFPMLQGIKNMTDALSGEKAGDVPGYLGREAASFIPASSAVAATARVLDPVGKRKPEGFTQSIMERLPGLRERLPAQVGPMGEVPERVSATELLFDPTRPQRLNTGPLYSALDEIGFYPTAGRRDPGESYADYSTRRQQEGTMERALLEDVLRGGQEGWSYVSTAASDSLDATGNWKFPLQSALSRQRTLVTNERNSRRLTP